ALNIRCLEACIANGYWRGVMWSLMAIAQIAEDAGMLAEAARLHGAVQGHLAVSSGQVFPARMKAHLRVAERLRERLGGYDDALCGGGSHQPWTVTLDDARRILGEVSGGLRPRPAPDELQLRRPTHSPLTERELEILDELVAGHTNQEIAASLVISPKT